MGAIFVTENAGTHCSTGKWPYPQGEKHEPDWGEWTHLDMGFEVRYCMFPSCDAENIRKIGAQ